MGCSKLSLSIQPADAMSGRLIAIGDIHGCSAALDAVLSALQPHLTDTIIPLGDYVDRGPDSRGVLEQLIALGKRTRLIPILGNHDEMLLNILDGHRYLLNSWLTFGGDATLASYGCALPEEIPAEDIAFLRDCRPWYESAEHFFVHASYLPKVPLKKQPLDVLRWEAIRDRPPGPHRSGKTAIVGHTAQESGEILDLGHLKCIATCVYGHGWLTAMDVHSGEVWQADKAGQVRR